MVYSIYSISLKPNYTITFQLDYFISDKMQIVKIRGCSHRYISEETLIQRKGQIQHLLKSCREEENRQDAKVNTQSLTPGLAQVSVLNSNIYSPKAKTPHTNDQQKIYTFTVLFFIVTESVCQSHNGSSASTKILYFTGKSPTPSMINIPKRLVRLCIEWFSFSLSLCQFFFFLFFKFISKVYFTTGSIGCQPPINYRSSQVQRFGPDPN